jgi:hypothetical protein
VHPWWSERQSATGTYVLPVHTDVKEAIKAALEEAGFTPSPGERAVSFSGVGFTTATGLYRKLGLSVDEGLKTIGLTEPLGGFPHCGQLNMSNYPNEEAATADFLTHIQKALTLQGVRFGRGGFEVMDLHKRRDLYKFEVDDAVYTGGLDGGILPYGVANVVPQPQLRCGIEIKHSDLHKALYQEQHGGAPASGNAKGINLSGSAGGQALVELLAAYVFSENSKVLLLLSSCDDNMVLEFDGEVVTRWTDISFDAAMYKMGQFLRDCNADRHLRFESLGLPQTEAEPMERLRKRLRPSNALLEQLDSVTAGMDTNGKFATAMEFMHAYRPSIDWGDIPEMMFT